MQDQFPPLPPTPPNNEQVNVQGVYEMLWDCRYCGTTQLLGKTHRFCPGCGAPQDANARYFPTEEQKIAVHQHVYVGVDKICSACQSPNAGNAEFCGQCGAPLTDAARAQLKSSPDSTPSRQAGQLPLSGSQFAGTTGKLSRYKLPIIVVALMALVGGAIVLFWTKEATVVVTDHLWEREIKIENFAPRAKGDWCNQIPHDAYNISRTSKVRSQQQIPDGEECSTRSVDQGDGTFRQEQVCRTKYRSEPVYDEYCHYTIDRWEHARSVKASNHDKNPIWPEFQLISQEREGQRLTTYTLSFKDEQEIYECAVDESLWQAAELGSQWSLEVRAITGGERCGTLRPVSSR